MDYPIIRVRAVDVTKKNSKSKEETLEKLNSIVYDKPKEFYMWLYENQDKLSSKLPYRLPKTPKDIGKGEGGGTAFDIGKDVVMKLTKDRSEAESSSVLVGKDLDFINRIYAVYAIEDMDAYLIFQEFLQPIEEQMVEAIDLVGDCFLELFVNNSEYNMKNFTKNRSQKIIGDLYNCALERRSKKVHFDPYFYKAAEILVSSYLELAAHNIDFHDYHAGNILKDGNNYKIIDLGVSGLSGKDKIKKISVEDTVALLKEIQASLVKGDLVYAYCLLDEII